MSKFIIVPFADEDTAYNAAAIREWRSDVEDAQYEEDATKAKQLEYLGNADTAGIALGARMPIVLTSRADARDTRLASCALAVILAHHYRASPP